MKDIAIQISGMSCNHCLGSVDRALHLVPGVEVKAVQIGRAELRIPAEGEAEQQIGRVLEEAGYRLEGIIG